MINRIKALVIKEFIQIRRDKRTLAMIIIIPVIWLAVFGYAASFDVNSLKVAVWNNSTTPLSEKAMGLIKDTERFELVDTAVDSEAGLTELLRKGQAQLGVIIPSGFGEEWDAEDRIRVLVDGADFFAAQASSQVLLPLFQELQRELAGQQLAERQQEVLRALSALPSGMANGLAEIAGKLPGNTPMPGLAPEIKVLYNPEMRSANVMIPGLLGLVIAFITTIMTAMGVVRERERGTLEQLVVTPLRSFELMIGKVSPYILIGLVDFWLVLWAGTTIFGVKFQGNLLVFSLMALLLLGCTLGTGILVSTLAQNQQQAMQAAMFTLFPQFLLSGFVFPLDSMPWLIQKLAYLFPLTYFMPITRGMFLKGVGLDLLYPQALALAGYAVAVLTIASIRFHKRLG
ncbi:MAG: ABC transporter permease [Bacillota bacterium]